MILWLNFAIMASGEHFPAFYAWIFREIYDAESVKCGPSTIGERGGSSDSLLATGLAREAGVQSGWLGACCKNDKTENPCNTLSLHVEGATGHTDHQS